MQTAGNDGKGTGLAPNIASVLCYICPPISGIIFLVIEKENRDVQFHAWQCITLTLVAFVLGVGVKISAFIFGFILGFLGSVLNSLLIPIIGFVFVVLLLISILKAYQGECWKIPYIGDFAAKQAGLAS